MATSAVTVRFTFWIPWMVVGFALILAVACTMSTKIVRKSLYLLYRLHTNQLNSSSNNTFV